jgi:DNA-directed RNA polymerase II subunit RPB2
MYAGAEQQELSLEDKLKKANENSISQEDAWAVISSYFEDKGLVRQQLDSYNEFTSNTMQEIVDETPAIIVRPEQQHKPGEEAEEDAVREYRVTFEQIFMSKPLVTEADGETSTLFPKEARLRNLT